jgi:hypothetical protein
MPLLPHALFPALDAKPPEGYDYVVDDRAGDAQWHYAMFLQDGVELAGGDPEIPEEGTTTRLALYQLPKPHADIEVMVHLMRYEINPADWLERAVAEAGRKVISSRHRGEDTGAHGDVLAVWSHEGEKFAGRFVASKWGKRLFVICCRTSYQDFDELAESFWFAVESLHPLEFEEGALTEDLNVVEEESPLDWKVLIPKSWDLQRYPSTADGAWFDAMHLAPAPFDEQLGDHDGRLSMAVLPRTAAKKPRDASNLLLNALRENDVVIENNDFVPDGGPDPWQYWFLITPITRYGAPGELRCRVMMSDDAWVVAAVMGPALEDDYEAWMRNKRVLDIATDSLEIGPL